MNVQHIPLEGLLRENVKCSIFDKAVVVSESDGPLQIVHFSSGDYGIISNEKIQEDLENILNQKNLTFEQSVSKDRCGARFILNYKLTDLSISTDKGPMTIGFRVTNSFNGKLKLAISPVVFYKDAIFPDIERSINLNIPNFGIEMKHTSSNIDEFGQRAEVFLTRLSESANHIQETVQSLMDSKVESWRGMFANFEETTLVTQKTLQKAIEKLSQIAPTLGVTKWAIFVSIIESLWNEGRSKSYFEIKIEVENSIFLTLYE